MLKYFLKPFVDKKSLCWHSRVENMCQWHLIPDTMERKWKPRGKQLEDEA